MVAPLPDINAILHNIVRHKFQSLIDRKDTYKQIRVLIEHVRRTLFTTPDRTIESLVMQQGDCNAGLTYQSLINHIFSECIGVLMDIYLDDIIIYSDSTKDHIRYIQLVLNVL